MKLELIEKDRMYWIPETFEYLRTPSHYQLHRLTFKKRKMHTLGNMYILDLSK